MKNIIKHIIFDRDGTLIKHKPYLFKSSEVELLPYVKSSLELLKKNNCILYLHTNQSGVGRGMFNLEDAVLCNNKMIKLLGLGNKIFNEICIAIDFPAKEKTFRKPSPDFALSLIKKYNISIKDLIYVGDSICDLETAKNVGCNAFGLNTGLINLNTELKKRNDINFEVFGDIRQLCEKILSHEQN